MSRLHPLCAQMKTILRSNDIYKFARKYYIIGIAIFDRAWCLAEVSSHGLVSVVVCLLVLSKRQR